MGQTYSNFLANSIKYNQRWIILEEQSNITTKNNKTIKQQGLIIT